VIAAVVVVYFDVGRFSESQQRAGPNGSHATWFLELIRKRSWSDSAAVLEQLGLPEISRMLRRTVFGAVGVGVRRARVLSIVGYPARGPGPPASALVWGLANIRLVMSTASG